MWIAIVISVVFVIVFLAKRMNTYALIARNATFISEILKDDFKESFPDEDSLLATSAVIDALIYIQKGQLTIEDIKAGILCAKIGQCHIGLGYRINLYDNAVECLVRDERNTFLWFISGN
jgi:hypothetical protein